MAPEATAASDHQDGDGGARRIADDANIDHYRLLGVSRDAPLHEIRQAYRRLAWQHHPDVSRCSDGASRFAALACAYAVLSDSAERARYDDSLRQSAPLSQPRAATLMPHKPADQQIFQRGILELSRSEAWHLARHSLTVADGHGRAVVLPGGTGDGDEIILFHDGRPAVLTICVRQKA